MSKLKNRGKEGRDDFLFQSKDQQRILKEAVKDMVHLLSRGYAEKSSLSLVGNRYRLNTRQQKAVRGMSASNTQLDHRRASHLESQQLENTRIVIDGFNLLIILESVLSGAYVFKGRDGCYRDLSSVHGSYKRVQKTETALVCIGEALQGLDVTSVL